MSSFSSSRLTLARKRRGLTKAQLSSESGITARTITKYENPDTGCEPDEKTASRLAEALGFPIGFFYKHDIDLLDADAVTFRSKARMTQRQRDKAISAGDLAVSISDEIDRMVNTPDPDIPDLSELDPESAASVLRAAWSMGDKPISDMIALLEHHGVRVFSLMEKDADEVDAFSFWRGRPFVMLDVIKSGERQRMDAAHELGHLVMHASIEECDAKAVEKEANEFASAFLMPASDVLSHAPSSSRIADYVTAKRRWRVSVSALVVRCHKLGMISNWQYQSLFKQMSARGMRTDEPRGIGKERSTLLEKSFSIIHKDTGKGAVDISESLGIPYGDFASLCFRTPFSIVK